jgi:hypothetical protein
MGNFVPFIEQNQNNSGLSGRLRHWRYLQKPDPFENGRFQGF